MAAVLAHRAADQNWADTVAGDMERHYSPGRTWEAMARSALPLLGVAMTSVRPSGDLAAGNYFGIPSRLPFTIGTPNNGGSVITAGGLIFIAATTDDLIRAIDIDTGEVVWQDVLPAGGQATPMTYEVNGRQYLAIFAGGHHFMETKIGDYLVVYSLPTPGDSSSTETLEE